MAQVLIRCPTTDREIYTGLNFDWDTLAWQPLGEMELACPACGEKHIWNKDDAYLRADGGDG